MSTEGNSKRIVKNTMFLYFRMLFLMAVSLYTSRIVLNTLGVNDYGIYNVVGGFVAMFTILSGSLSNAISRFITYELGKQNSEKLKEIFSIGLIILMGISAIILVIAESIGVWFLNSKMFIPEERLTAANFVFQFSIFTFIVNLISVPYNAVIIAHEKMDAFAYISIVEALLKLTIAFLITISPIDKLVFYAFLMFGTALIIRLIYKHYCEKHFLECKFHVYWNIDLLKKMFSFAGWNFIGTSSFILMTQGINILINMFFGVAFNAARGIANQVDNAIVMFSNNFTTAINPQIIKSYASDDMTYMYKLICSGSKYSFFLLWILSLPILIETDTILKIWLGNVPQYASMFLKYTILISLLSVISNTLVTSVNATGNIRNYQIIVGGLGLCIFPIVYIAYKLKFPVEVAYIIHFCIFVLQLIVRLFFLKRMIKFPIKYFWMNTISKDILIVISSIIMPLIIYVNLEESYLRLILISLSSFTLTFILIIFLGLNKEERNFLYINLKKIIPFKH